MILRDTKNGDDRAVPLSKSALSIARRQLERPRDCDDPRLFPITRDTIVAAWRRVLIRARIEDYRFHDLRHEATSRLFERGLSIMEVQRITGHKTLAMLIRYTHMNVGRLVDRLDATEGGEPPAAKSSKVQVGIGSPMARLDDEVTMKAPAPLAASPPENGSSRGGLPPNVVRFAPRSEQRQ